MEGACVRGRLARLLCRSSVVDPVHAEHRTPCVAGGIGADAAGGARTTTTTLTTATATTILSAGVKQAAEVGKQVLCGSKR